MSKKMIGLIIVGVLVLWLFISGIAAYKEMNNFDIMVNAQIRDEQNVYNTTYQKIVNSDAVFKQNAKAVKEAIAARFGGQGSQATFQWFQSQVPDIDSKLTMKMMSLVEDGYNEFGAKQTTVIDTVAHYEKLITSSIWNNLVWAPMFGFPKTPWEKLKMVISAGEVKTTFETGVMNPILNGE